MTESRPRSLTSCEPPPSGSSLDLRASSPSARRRPALYSLACSSDNFYAWYPPPYPTSLPRFASPHGAPIPPVPAKIIQSFFDHSPLPAFTIPAQPLFIALCRRPSVSKFEDPGGQAPTPSGDADCVDRTPTSPRTPVVHPHLNDQKTDASRERSLDELLRTSWANPAAEDLARQTLNYHHTDSGMPNVRESSWDLLSLLGSKDLARFLRWMRQLFSCSSASSPSANPPCEFRTEFHCSEKYRLFWQTRRKEHANKHVDHHHRRSSTIPLPAEAIIVPTFINCSRSSTQEEPLPAGSRFFQVPQQLSPHHAILFTVTVLRQPPRRQPSYTSLASSSNGSQSSAATPTSPISTSDSDRLKASTSDLRPHPPCNPHPPSLHFETSLPLMDPLSQAAQDSHSMNSSKHWRWLSEKEAKRAITRSARGRRNRKSSEVETPLETDPEVVYNNKAPEYHSVKEYKHLAGKPSPKSDLFSPPRRPRDPTDPKEAEFLQETDLERPLVNSSNPFHDLLEQSNMGRLILSHCWEKTALGPMDIWSPTLRSMILMILSSPYRMSLLWSEEYVMLYNDAYVKSCGSKHPTLLGQCGAHGWAELWADLGQTADMVFKGTTYTAYDSLLFMDRNPLDNKGIRHEECYHSFSWIPVRGPTGQVEGIFNPSFETTARVVAERRLGTLRDLDQIALVSRDRPSFESGCLDRISMNPYDLPFAILYNCATRQLPTGTAPVAVEKGVEPKSKTKRLQLQFAGAIAVPLGHPSASDSLEFTIQILDSSHGDSPHSSVGSTGAGNSIPSSNTSEQTVFMEDRHHVWPLQEACTLRKPIFIEDLGTRALGFEKRGWNDEPRSAVVMPVTTCEGETPSAVIIFGLSPRLYWTEAYGLFLNLITRQISNGLTLVMGHEAEAQRLADLAALNRARTTFFTNVSHELRTPLTLIAGPISDLLESPEGISQAARDRLKIVQRNTQRLINQVNQLLDVARFEAGRMTARFRSTDLSKLTADLASFFRSSMQKNSLELKVDCPETSERVWVDEDFMEKVIFNLISNSMKFTRRGGNVTVRVQFDLVKCYLIVSDTGVGIKPEELPKIFERFHRADEAAHHAEGTGIGLSLVQDIVKLHGGNLTVNSEYGCGSTFTAAFLLGNSHLPEGSLDYSSETGVEKTFDRVITSNARRWMLGGLERALSYPKSECSDSTSSISSGDFSVSSGENAPIVTAGSKILIADDNADMRFFLRSVLSRYFSISEASNGLEAYQMAKTNRPDLVLSDVMMPEMDGFQLLKRLKGDPDTVAISVFLLSARADSEIRVESLAEGADDYLVKPFEAKELLARINTHLSLAQMRQRLEKEVSAQTLQLKQSETKYKNLYHSFQAISMFSPVGIIQWNADWKITFVNDCFRKQSQLGLKAPMDTWVKLICDEDRVRIEEDLKETFETECTSKGEFRWKHGSWCLYEVQPHYDEDKNLVGCLGSTTDVTARKELERKQLEAAEARARDAEESKRQQEAFIDMTSHEIRNPLHGIHQAAELLNTSLKLLHETVHGCDGKVSSEELGLIQRELEEDIDAVESIQLCASHQSRIADDIINVSKLSMGLLTTIKTEFDLVGRVREVLSMYLIEAQSKNVTLDIQVGEGLREPVFIFADPNRLAQVVINFLSNALRYTSASEGRRIVTVQVDLYAHLPALPPDARRIGTLKPELADEPGGMGLVYAKVGVRDTARGLSQDELAKLFVRFAQANPTQDQYGGSGLGLYVSRCLIENHGGFIEVVSTKGEGSIFSFVIPVQQGMGMSKLKGGPRLIGVRKHLGGEVKNKRSGKAEIKPVTSLVPVASLPLAATKRVPSPSPEKEGKSVAIASRSASQQRKTKEPGKSEAVSAISKPPAVKNQTHVLVVEDNMINVKVIKRQLTLKGYAVSVAMDGRKALDMLYADDAQTSKSDPIDIVLMDIQMPVMSGLDAIMELRAAEKAGRVKRRYPVIAVTGNARTEQTEQYLSSGFNNICVKPYKIDDVERHMENLLAAFRIVRD